MNPKSHSSVALVLDAVSEFLIDNPTLTGKYLVAVSGGVDSVVLLKALSLLSEQSNLQLGVFHLNHLFRGDDSDLDAQLVKDMALALHLPYFGYRRPVQVLSMDYGIGFEAMGRRLRYDLVEALFCAEGYRGLFTAHHADDQAETVLMHLFRGSSLKGLTGIAPIQGYKLRPLLGVEKSVLLEVAKHWQLSFREDCTNQENIYLRNYVRNALIPQISDYYGYPIGRQLAKMAQVIKADEDCLDQQTKQLLEQSMTCEDHGYHLQTQAFIDAPQAIQRRLFVKYMHTILDHASDLTFQPIEQWLNWLNYSQVGSEYSYLGVHFEKRKRFIRAMRQEIFDTLCNTSPVKLKLGVQRLQSWGIELTVSPLGHDDVAQDEEMLLNTIVIPESRWAADIWVRPRQEGDSIATKGMQGKRKSLKKLFSEWDLSIDQKSRMPIIVKASEVLWIPFKLKTEIIEAQIKRDLKIFDKENEQSIKIVVRRI